VSCLQVVKDHKILYLQILSPRLDNDDGDILADFPHNDLFGHDLNVPLENQTVFPPAGIYGEQYNQPIGFAPVNEPFPDFAQLDRPAQSWDFGGLSFSDRVFKPSNEYIIPHHPQPMQQRVIATPKLLDLRCADIKPAAGPNVWQEATDLIVKVQQGYNIQELSSGDPMAGIEALRQSLMASFRVGNQRGLSSQDIQRLLVRGAAGDPVMSGGKFVEHLTAQHLQTALHRYGMPRNEHYKLGIVRFAQETFQFEVSLLPNLPPQDDQIIIWVFQELCDYDVSTGQSNFSRWSAVAPSNITSTTKNYAQALTLPTPTPKEVHVPVNTDLLHVGRRSTASSHTGTQSASSSSSAPMRRCGKVWPTRASFK